METIAYGEPRLTNDLDVLGAPPLEQVERLCDTFPEDDSYLSGDAAREAVLRHHQFNIIKFASGLKGDVIMLADDDFERSRKALGRALPVGAGWGARFASP